MTCLIRYVGSIKNVNDIINSVNDAWGCFDHAKLEKAFCSLNMVFDAVIVNYCENTYALPHLGKDAILRTEGILAMREKARQASEIAVGTEIRGWISSWETFGNN